MGFDVVQSSRNVPTFRKNLMPSFSGWRLEVSYGNSHRNNIWLSLNGTDIFAATDKPVVNVFVSDKTCK